MRFKAFLDYIYKLMNMNNIVLNTGNSLTNTKYAVEVYFEPAHHTVKEVGPGKDVSSMGHMRGRTAAG